jgi:hypothetical protein
MCDWMKRQNKLVTFSLSEPHELQEGLWIRTRTLDVLVSILLESSFPSKVSGKADGILLMLNFIWLHAFCTSHLVMFWN